MDFPTAQRFFDDHARHLASDDIDAMLPAYSVPLSLHFEGGDIVLGSYQELHLMLVRHRLKLYAHAVGTPTPKVVEIEDGLKNRCRIGVDWQYRVTGALRHTKVDYFFEHAGGRPKIGMVDFDIPVPDRYGDLTRTVRAGPATH